jgi:hypothetical protein
MYYGAAVFDDVVVYAGLVLANDVRAGLDVDVLSIR